MSRLITEPRITDQRENMPEQRWTFLCLRDGESPIRQFSVSAKAIHYVAAVIAGVVLLLTSLTTLVLIDGSARIDARRMAAQNRLLDDEITSIEGHVGVLSSELDRLMAQDSRYRLLAGLNAIDDEVLQVGVGGPGLPKPEDSPLWAHDEEGTERSFALSYDVLALQRRARLLSASLAEASDSLEAHRDLLESTPSILPSDGLVSSRFSRSRLHPIHHKPLPHPGVDISAPKGTPIMAAARGTVTYAGWRTGLGYMVEVDHGFGYITRYGHASELIVRAGQKVTRGETLAMVGMTGIATAPHLHYEVWVGGKAQNPMDYMIGSSIP